jgi:hypothetical protein
MKLNINTLKEHIQKEGLRLMNEEAENIKKLESTIEDIDEGLIDLYEKKFEKLKKDEEKAVADEEFSQLKRIKDEQVEVLDKLITFYEKKVEVLNKIGDEIKNSASEVGTKGRDVFSNKSMEEFKNEDIVQNTKIKIAGSSKFFIAEKVSENNTYNVLESNITGIEPGDFLKISDMKVGGSGSVTVYRKVGDRFDELKTMKFNNVTEIIKNPS